MLSTRNAKLCDQFWPIVCADFRQWPNIAYQLGVKNFQFVFVLQIPAHGGHTMNTMNKKFECKALCSSQISGSLSGQQVRIFVNITRTESL